MLFPAHKCLRFAALSFHGFAAKAPQQPIAGEQGRIHAVKQAKPLMLSHVASA
jgi:hypothetical protein